MFGNAMRYTVPIKSLYKGERKMNYSKADFKMLKGQTVKLQIVDYGEEVKAKIVGYGEDVSYQKVNYGNARKTIKVKIVTYGEDVKLKEKSYGADFNAIIC